MSKQTQASGKLHTTLKASVLELIGETPLVRLDRYFQDAQCQVVGKCDFMNPSGSVKDRIGWAMLKAAEESGKIAPGGTLVEATAGNTGLGLCIAAAVKGYKVICCTPDKMSQEKINLMRAFGARVIVTPTVPEDDPQSYSNTARRIAQETPNALYIGQFENPANAQAHYEFTGPEIWEQTNGELNVFIASAGTGGTMTGVSRYLKERNPKIKTVLADPEGSLYAHFIREKNLDCPSHPYKVEGIGHDYIPKSANFSHVDLAYTITDRESFNAARRLARLEGLFCGGSTGTNLVAAQRYIEEYNPSPDTLIVVFLCDTGERYLSKMYNDDWMRENQFLGGSGKRAIDLLYDKQANAPSLVSSGPETSLDQIFEQIKQLDISQVPVVSGSTILGTITENKVLDFLMQGKDLTALSAKEVMGPPLATVPAHASAQEMLAAMRDSQQEAVIVQHGSGFDILTKFDLVRAL